MWEDVATRYEGNDTILGVDLHNEPHNSATWGDGGPTDWARAATEAGNAVLDINPNWLIVVEGISNYDGDNYWWGGNLQGVADHPIVLDTTNQLVYSPHDYPASVFEQSWFFDGSDLSEVFRENWGFIYEEGIAPILLGEFGSRLETDVDRAWADAITAYLAGDFDNNGTIDIPADDAGISFAWWSWNPNSGDTGGILEDDWETPRESALDALENLLSTPATISGNTVTGTSGADVIDETYFDVDGDAISSGDDVVFGGSGADRIYGGSGRDRLNGGADGDDGGADYFDGGAGSDTVSYWGWNGSQTANTKTLTVDLSTGENNNADTYVNIENLLGSNTQKDIFTGTDGANRLNGAGGDDTLDGAGGDDFIAGGSGDDDLSGGEGDDVLTGGTGEDIFVFNQGWDQDQVIDFEDDIDTIIFRNFDLADTQDALSFADQVGDDVVFDFGSGDTLTISHTNISALEDDISVF